MEEKEEEKKDVKVIATDLVNIKYIFEDDVVNGTPTTFLHTIMEVNGKHVYEERVTLKIASMGDGILNKLHYHICGDKR